jgi:capsular polysaccharide biosynthesis protein
LYNADLIPDPVRRAVETSWTRGVFAERKIKIRAFADVFVAKEGLVFDRALRLVRSSVTQHSTSEIEWARGAIVSALGAGDTPRLSGTCVLCKKRGAGNYGHWLIEMFPKAVVAQQQLPGEAMRFLVPDAKGRLGAAIEASMQRLGVCKERLVRLDDAPVRVDRLVMVDGLTEHGVYMSPLAVAAAEALSWDVPIKQDRLLYIARSAGHRKFRDEAEVLRRASAAGYRVFDPGAVSLLEQAATFAGARTIVGIMGAALTNIVFAWPSTEVIALAPATMPDTFFWFIAGLRGLRYREIRCPLYGPVRGVAPWDRDLVFPEDIAQEIFPCNTA